jgi:hypothetical protein
MQVIVYHEVRPETLDEILREGIKRSDHGEKSDSVVQRTDDCLEARIPAHLRSMGLGRHNVVYAYLSAGANLIDIRNGNAVDVNDFSLQRELVLLRITADTELCFVSDLDAYDAVRKCVESDADDTLLTQLADRYWARVIPFEDYRAGQYRRPEVMIKSDVDASSIDVVRPAA